MRIRDIIISNVNKSGFVDLRHILNEDDYTNTQIQFKQDNGIIVPDISVLYECSVRPPIFILLRDISISYDMMGKRYTYTFKAGLPVDLASVPKAFQSIVQNDDPDVILAAFIHDYNFRTRYFGASEYGYELSNHVFEIMIELAEEVRGAGRSTKSEKYYMGVSTKIGEKRYYEELPTYMEDFVTVSVVDIS